MYYVYRISSSYNGFTPKKILSRLVDVRYLEYNWNQYYDQLEKGDIVFTFFTGRGILPGIYLISKIVEIKGAKKAKGKVLRYDMEKPIIPGEEFNRIKNLIFTRPRGSVFVIPPSIDPFFDKVLSKEILSDIEIFEKVDCRNCKYEEDFRKCPIFSPEYMINWNKEVNLRIPGLNNLISPFWILPRQSWWMKLSYGQHIISKIFYAFKAGYDLYARLFTEGIVIAIKRHDYFNKLRFDFITNIPLSPEKKTAGELDRVDLVCSILSVILDLPYIKNMLVLSKPISRREYKFLGKSSSDFVKDYFQFLEWNTNRSLDNKKILIVDDVSTEGKTLMTFVKKIHERYPKAQLYVATCGVMAKKRNMTTLAIKRYEREY